MARVRVFLASLQLLAVCAVLALGGKFVAATLSSQRLIEIAQQEGAGFPRGDARVQPRTLSAIGTAERKCVEFPAADVQFPRLVRRSGEFVAGGQIAALQAGARGKVAWNTLHNPQNAKAALLVRGTRLDRPEITSRFVSSRYGWPVLKDGHAHQEYAFFPSAFSLPSPGRWLLVATAGNDWGCFIVTVQ